MAQDLVIAGATYEDVPSISVPKNGGGVADYVDTSDANATTEDILKDKTAYVNGEKVIGTYEGSSATLITKSITANGTYNASSDNADGYSSVTVDVPSADPNEQLTKLLLGTATYIKISDTNITNLYIFPTGNQDCAYFSIKNRNADWYISNGFNKFGQRTQRNFLNLAFAIDIAYRTLWNAKAYTIVLTSTSVPRLTGSLAVENNHAIYVRDSLLAGYKSASNWSAYGDVLKGYSESPVWDNNTTYGISDVCQYSGRFYSYCKSDLTSSAGHAPSGTTDDNDYWEYLAEVNS